jgi:predicted type IV restriction endonuclease
VPAIPKKVEERLIEGIKKFKPIIDGRSAADAGEADTVMLVTDVLSEVFGYDRYSEITSEFPVKSTRCDLATKVDEQLQTLIEVKAIGHALKDSHVTQAVNYAANHGGEWVVLTNARYWRVYSVKCAGKVDCELVVEIDFLSLDHKSDNDLALLFLLCKEGWAKSAIGEYQTHREAINRYVIAATILSDGVLATIKRELRRVSPDARIEIDEITEIIEKEVIKRELLDGEKAEDAKNTVKRAAKVALRDTAQSG